MCVHKDAKMRKKREGTSKTGIGNDADGQFLMKQTKAHGSESIAASPPSTPEVDQFLSVLARVAQRIADEESPRRGETNK